MRGELVSLPGQALATQNLSIKGREERVEGDRGYSKDFFQLHKVYSNKVKLCFEKLEAQQWYVK